MIRKTIHNLGSSGRIEQFSLSFGMPSDQERAEENLERMRLAQTGKNCRLELQAVGEAIGAEKGKRRQEYNWNRNGPDVLNAWKRRKP